MQQDIRPPDNSRGGRAGSDGVAVASGERISRTKTPPTCGAAERSYYGVNPHTDMETLTTETGDVRSTYRYTGYGQTTQPDLRGVFKLLECVEGSAEIRSLR
jgi:hypothetical protein